MATDKPVVVITGVSGYLGAQVGLAFLKDGSYRVRGTVRSTSNEEKIKPLKDGFGDLFDQIELVEADLTDEASLLSACAGATYVIHTASPFHFKGDCVGPAVAGANAIMKACTAHGVKRVVITSSSVSVQCPAKEDAPPQGTPFTEENWSNPDRPEGLMDYFKSKTLAEKAAWDYQAANPGFDLSVINPVFIMGPSFTSGDGTSEAFQKAILDGTKTEIPVGGTGIVDVRDVALAHLRCIQVPEAANKRFLLNSHRVMYKDIYGWLAAKYNDKGAKVATSMAAGDEPTEFDLLANTRSKEVLGIVYTDMEKTFIDGADSLIARGQVKLC